jgi:hypothetical protein
MRDSIKQIGFAVALGIAGALVLTSESKAAGSCIRGPIASEHKVLHLAGSAAVTTFVGTALNDPMKGVYAGIAVGAVRELEKRLAPDMRCEYSSMAWDAAGVGIGYLAAKRLTVSPVLTGHKLDGVKVTYSVPLN